MAEALRRAGFSVDGSGQARSERDNKGGKGGRSNG
jgi:hypothetical protein